MFINSRDGFATNASYDCKRSIRIKEKRAARRMFGTPSIKGPVYTYRRPEPTRESLPDVPLKSSYTSGPVYVYRRPEQPTIKPYEPKSLAEKEKSEGILGKIGAFFASVAASINEIQETELTPNVHMSDGDILVLRSMEDSAVEYDSEDEAREALKSQRKPYRSKSSIKHAEKYKAKNASVEQVQPETNEACALDIKYVVESEARRYNENRKELLTRFDKLVDNLPEDGAYRYVSREYLDELTNSELDELLVEIQKAIMLQNVDAMSFNKEKWNILEEYLLFAKDVNVKRFVQMLDASGVNIMKPTEMEGLVEWSSNDTATKADFRYSGDVVHNWCVTNLKNSFYEAYKAACEDGGKLDHDPLLNFPNGAKTRLSRFIGDNRFDEISEKGARGKDIAEVSPKDVQVANLNRKSA